jgi:prepilin-type N-terminal cleavage/methylation domain-containing protein
MKLKPNLPTRSGITILELLIVVAIIAVIAGLAFPSYVRARQRGQNVQTMQDLKTFSGQLEIFNGEMRVWPDERLAGNFPDRIAGQNDNQLEQSIKRANWFRGPAVGGQFDWDYNVGGVHAAVAIANPTASAAQMQQLNKMLDTDDSLTEGVFRQVTGGYIYVLAETPNSH